MVYVKNIPNWERVLRIVRAISFLAYAGINWGSSGLAVNVGVAGAMMTMTGLVGLCPMCAMVGRRLKKES